MVYYLRVDSGSLLSLFMEAVLKTEQTVYDAVNPIITSLGYEIVEVEYVKKGNDMNLTIYIDTPRGVSLDDCEKVHYAVDPVLDEINPTDDKPYVLNISSPGLDRPFKTHRDFERNYGREVEVKLYAPLKGKKIYEGILVSHSDNAVTINSGVEEITIETNRIALTRPLVKFE